MVVTRRDGTVIVTSRKDGLVVDLLKYTDPRRHTKQIPQADRYGYEFAADDMPRLLLCHDDGLQRWTEEADKAAPMTTEATEDYCLAAGHLWARSEVPRWGIDGLDVCGLIAHGWEGGNGAPVCLACFRPWPSKPTRVRLSATIG
jgi:hypothetical protein